MKNQLQTKHMFFVAIIFFLYLFLVYRTDFHGPDKPIYFAYTASVVEDGDLNAINHLDKNYPYYLPEGKIGVSKTYNLPDFHNHGGVVLWVPFYLYAKFIYFVDKKSNLLKLKDYGKERITKAVLSYSTIVFSFFTIFFTYFLGRILYSPGITICSILTIFLGTPFFYYSLFEPGNANITAALFAVLLISIGLYAANMRKSFWFFYGLLFGIASVVKVDLWFYIVFIFMLYLFLLRIKRTNILSGMYFLVGFIPLFLLKTINDYIKYGSLHMGEFSLINFKASFLTDQLFSNYRGFFYTSPVFYICILGLLFYIIAVFKNRGEWKQRFQEIFVILLGFLVLIKILIIAKRFAWGGGTCGARPLLTEFPIFVVLFARVLYTKKKQYLTWFLVLLVLLCIIWNLLVISEYMLGVDLKYIANAPDLGIRLKNIGCVLKHLITIKDLDLKLKLSIPLLIVVFYITYILKRLISSASIPWKRWNHKNVVLLRIFYIFTAYVSISYVVITGLNLINNRRNVARLKKQGFFKDVKVLTMKNFEKIENAGSMDEMIAYFTLKGDFNRVDSIKKHKKEMYDSGY